VALLSKASNVRFTIARALGRQSALPGTAIEAIIAILADRDEDVRFNVAEALGYDSALLDNILDAIGLSQTFKRQPKSNIYLDRPQTIASLYKSLLYRSFREHLSFSVDADPGQSLCIINQSSGVRYALCRSDRILNAVDIGRQIWNTTDYSPWRRIEEENIAEGMGEGIARSAGRTGL
jgi:hypothetical protein